MNYQTTLFLVENKADGASLLLYGFSVPTERHSAAWKKSDVKFKESAPVSGNSLKAFRLTGILSDQEFQELSKKLTVGFPRIKTDRPTEFALFGEWQCREPVEVMDDELNPLPFKTSNLTGCGANTKKTFWSLSDDPLSDFLSHVSGSSDASFRMHLTSSYDEILELASNETGLNFRSDDFLSFGNLDIFENRFGNELDVVGFKVLVDKTGNPNTKELDLDGLSIELLEPLLKFDSLIFRIDLNGTSDRIFATARMWKKGDPNSFQVRPTNPSFFSSYRVEVFDASTGDFLSKESNFLMTEIHMNMSLINQSRSVSTEWSRRQLAVKSNIDSKSLQKTTLTSDGPWGVVGGSRKQEPWRKSSSKVQHIRSLYSQSDYDYLVPKIDNITDVDRVKPMMDLLSKGRYEVVDIFDPYFDSYSIEKLLLRISSQSLQVNIYTYDEHGKQHFNDLISSLSKVREWIPCPVNVFTVVGGFHDRFFIGYKSGLMDVFAVTNSLDGYSKSYPMWIVPMRGKSSVRVSAYIDTLRASAVKKWDLAEENKKERESFSRSLSSEESKRKIIVCDEYKLAKTNNLVDADDRIRKDKYEIYLDLLESQIPNFSYDVLAQFAYWGTVSESDFYNVLKERLNRSKLDEIERFKSSIRELVSDAGGDLHYLGVKQLLESYSQDRSSIDLSKSFRDIESLFAHPLRMYKMPNRHRIILWSWLIKFSFHHAYSLFLETLDIAFIMSLVDGPIYRSDVPRDLVRVASQNRGDRLLFTFALIVVTRFSPDGGVPHKEKAYELVEKWMDKAGSDVWDTLLTFAFIIGFGKSGNEDSDLEMLLDKISALWKRSPVDKEHFESINVLIRGGLIDMKDKQVFLFAKKLEGIDETWSHFLYEKILGRLENTLKKEGSRFHFFHSEDNGLLEASRHILDSWSNDDRNAWFAAALPDKVRFLPNRPFIAKKDFDAYSGAINQMGLWAIMKLAFAQQPDNIAEVLDDIDKYLLPAAYQHGDFFKILNSLFQNIYKLRHQLDEKKLFLLTKWETQVRQSDCVWWPSLRESNHGDANGIKNK